MGGQRSGWWSWCCCVLWTCAPFVGMLRAETIHFTNSPKLILASKNYTTYELEVPGSKPITIIEATEPLGSANQRVDTFPSDPQQLRVGPASTTSFRTSTGLSVSRPPSDDEPSGGTPRKTLYSPELLNKFLKEYSEKLRNADPLTRKRLNEITMMNGVQQAQNDGIDSTGEEQRPEYPPYRGKPEDARGQQNQSSVEVSAPEEGAKTADEFVFEDTHERHGMMGAASINKRWYQDAPMAAVYPPAYADAQKPHPWNVKDGWVTLEAVPWSESKVSKWHAASVAEANRKQAPGKGQPQPQVHQTLGNYWSDESDEEPPKYRPASPSPSSIGASSYYQDGQGVDEYGSAYGGGRQPTNRLPNPPESLYNRRRPPHSERPDDDRGSRPTPQQPQDGWYEHQLQASPYDSMKAYHEPAPPATSPNRDIITDGRPANFPKYAPDRAPAAHGSYGPATNTPPQNVRARPGSYPDHGNGEWVLISTTKGYQYPKRRHGQRAITFTPATSTSHQTVKLTVLPMKNAVDMTTSHNGLIEVSSSTQTVEDAVKQQKTKTKNKRQQPTRITPKRKKQSSAAGVGHGQGLATTTYSVMRRDAAQDSSAVLAAVGAGMVPATMAILAPMVLGKKKK